MLETDFNQIQPARSSARLGRPVQPSAKACRGGETEELHRLHFETKAVDPNCTVRRRETC